MPFILKGMVKEQALLTRFSELNLRLREKLKKKKTMEKRSGCSLAHTRTHGVYHINNSGIVVNPYNLWLISCPTIYGSYSTVLKLVC